MLKFSRVFHHVIKKVEGDIENLRVQYSNFCNDDIPQSCNQKRESNS